MISRKGGLATEYCSKWRQRRILGFFVDEFHKEKLYFRLLNFGEWPNVLRRLGWRKYTFLGVAFSFNIYNVTETK